MCKIRNIEFLPIIHQQWHPRRLNQIIRPTNLRTDPLVAAKRGQVHSIFEVIKVEVNFSNEIEVLVDEFLSKLKGANNFVASNALEAKWDIATNKKNDEIKATTRRENFFRQQSYVMESRLEELDSMIFAAHSRINIERRYSDALVVLIKDVEEFTQRIHQASEKRIQNHRPDADLIINSMMHAGLPLAF